MSAATNADRPARPPPGASGDPLWFSTPVLNNLLNTLLNLASRGTFVAVIKADEGMGKTVLMERLALTLAARDDLRTVKIRCRPGLSATGELVRTLGVDLGDPGVLVNTRIIQGLARLRADGTAPVLLADDAHHMEPEDLALLIRLSLAPNANHGGLLHMILFARPEIVAGLAALPEEIPSGRLFTLVPAPFNREQIRDYLAFRLRLQGMEHPPPLRESELGAIQQRSGGIPLRLNAEAERLIRRGGGRRRRVLLPLVAVATLAAGTAWWLLPAGVPIPQSTRPVADTAVTPDPVSVPPVSAPAEEIVEPAVAAETAPAEVPAESAVGVEPASAAPLAATPEEPAEAVVTAADPLAPAAGVPQTLAGQPETAPDEFLMTPRPTLRATVTEPPSTD